MGKVREIVVVVLVAMFFVKVPATIAEGHKGMLESLTYCFFHANVFHLAANLLAAWTMLVGKNALRDLVVGFAVSTAVYFFATTPVIGFSNVLFTILGIRAIRHNWYCSWYFLATIAALLISFFIPKIAAVTHLAAFGLGFFYGSLQKAIAKLDLDYGTARGGK